MAQTLHVVLTDPDEAGERDIEIRHTDSFVLVRSSGDDLRGLFDRDGSTQERPLG
ncbi:hypothetical protein ACPPVO_57345 [Dactylosporangium sp. McL0621]|uniref:hypothetical protein n=1 Tax=Dactylosporangium sp. McL0621 TaxID=3415678 RepID=UPI003CF3B6B8